MAHFPKQQVLFHQQQVLRPLGFLSALECAVQAFTYEDEEDSHGNEGSQRADMNVRVKVPVEDCRGKHDTDRECKKTGTSVEEQCRGENWRDKENEPIGSTPTLQGKA